MITAGEAMGAIRADGLVRLGARARISIAGAEANVAIGLARLGHAPRWVGVVGTDQLGALVLRTLRAEGVDVSAVRTDQAPTGVIVFEERLAGVARVDYHRRGSAGSLLAPDDLLDAWEPAPRVLHVTGLTMALGAGPAETVRAGVRAARERDVTVCLDVNHREKLWTSASARQALVPLADALDVVIASEDELGLVAPGGDEVGAHADSLLESGVDQVVVKLGAHGARAYTRDGTFHVPARPVRPVDPIGAGDAFVAGYLSGLLDGLTVPERLELAVTTGAFVVATAGDWEGLPNREELRLLDLSAGEVVR